MDFELGEKAETFRAEVRAFFDEQMTDEIRERVHRTGTVHDWSIHRALAERGWLAASWPVEYGGQGRDPLEMVAFAEEAQRCHAPMIGLNVTMMVSTVLRQCAGEELKQEIIPRVLAGELLFCLGYSEPDAGSDVASVKTRAVRDGDEWVINGQKMFTTLAHEATHVFLLTRTNPSVPKHQGLTMFLVPLDSPGIEVRPVHTLGGERTNITFYSDVRVPDRMRVGEVDDGWGTMTVALTYERGGGGGAGGPEALEVLDHAVRWAQRHDGSGDRPIDDPLVKERLGRMAVEGEVARLLDLRVRWIAASGERPGVEGSMSKLFSSELLVRAADELLDMLGPSGLLQHGEPAAPSDGWIEHSHRHAAVTTIYGGTSEVQRGIIAERGLGLPRGRPAPVRPTSENAAR